MKTPEPQIYLAARYSRREELCRYREELRSAGKNVQARWLDVKHQLSNNGTPIGDDGEALVEEGGDKAALLRAHFAKDDWEDVTSSDLVINFTEKPRSTSNRGGRHVEFGIALALKTRVIVVGHRENIFHWLPWVEFCETWEQAKELALSAIQSDAREGMVPAAELRPTIELMRRIRSHYYTPESSHYHLAEELTRLETLLGEKESK